MLKIEKTSKEVKDIKITDGSKQVDDVTQITQTMYIEINLAPVTFPKKEPVTCPNEETKRLCEAIKEVADEKRGKKKLKSIGELLDECRNSSD